MCASSRVGSDPPAAERRHCAGGRDSRRQTIKVVTATHPAVEDVAEVEVISLLKGAVKGRSLTLRVNPFLDHGPERLVADRSYILFLRQDGRSPSAFELMSDGTRPYEEEAADQIVAAVKLMPQWSRPQKGVAVIAVPEKFTYRLGEVIHLMIGYKNLSSARVVLRYRDWPPGVHSLFLGTCLECGEDIDFNMAGCTPREREPSAEFYFRGFMLATLTVSRRAVAALAWLSRRGKVITAAPGEVYKRVLIEEHNRRMSEKWAAHWATVSDELLESAANVLEGRTPDAELEAIIWPDSKPQKASD
jgi:hypothetical protein